MIEKLKAINPYDETEIDMDTNSVAGLVYENTPLVQKINELVDAVNNQQIQLNNHECRLLDLQNQINEHDQEIDDCVATISKMENVEHAENVQQMIDGLETEMKKRNLITNGDGKMNNDMKCPFCQQKLESFFVENRSVFACCNLNCKGYFMNAPKELWQELIRTRKALGVAVDALKKIKSDCYDATDVLLCVNTALDEITALEQGGNNDSNS